MNSKKTIIAAVVGFVVVWLGLMLYNVRLATQAQKTFEYTKMAQIQEALSVNPNDPAALRGMATHLIINHDHKAAIEYLEKAVQVDPDDRGSQLRLAHVLLLDRQRDKALPILRSLAVGKDDIARTAKGYLKKLNMAIILYVRSRDRYFQS